MKLLTLTNVTKTESNDIYILFLFDLSIIISIYAITFMLHTQSNSSLFSHLNLNVIDCLLIRHINLFIKRLTKVS